MIFINMKFSNVFVGWNLFVLLLAGYFTELDAMECGGKLCPMYSYCNPTTNNCTCINIKTLEEPQCGSDGKTYPSLQALQKDACETNRSIYPSKKGHCFNCSDSRCHSYTTCNKDLDVCFCRPVLEIFDPVCGSDGKTYDSIYQLNHTACMEERDITNLYSGFCKGSGVCGDPSCPIYSKCNTVTNKCECRQPAKTVSNEVCGSDNVTYPNLETLEFTACNKNTTITAQRNGKCLQAPNCDVTFCQAYAVCNKVTNKCECKAVSNDTTHMEEVCGTDGKTYKNVYMLQYDSCRNASQVQVKHNGKCSRGQDRLMLYILIGVGVFVVVMFIVLTIVCCIQQRKDRKSSKIEYTMNDYEAPLM